MSRALDIISLVICAGGVVALFWIAFEHSANRSGLILRWLISAPILALFWFVAIPEFKNGGIDALFGLGVACFGGFVMAILWAGSFTDLLAKPLASLYDGGTEPPVPKPYYSVAVAKRKRNKPLEAVITIREQLAKFPNDYEGTMLLASIQAEDLMDLSSAEMTLNHFCEWDKAPPKQVAAALTQMADWHLKLAQDAHSAAVALERIVEKFPETDIALVAKQRIAHLGGVEKILLDAHDRQPVFVPEGVKNVGLLESSAHLVPTEISPGELAASYVKQLEQHPNDTEAREKLAIIYVRHFKRLDLATIELEQMIGEPNHHYKRVAHWLNLLADLQIHGGADYETARATLERIIERFPDFGISDIARNRLAHLKLEFKALETTPEKTMGVYEQNVGLKGSRYYDVR
ncbi:MAG TPA: tetratricopeptide repeat protein [Candidatus Acidoferrales bacterium]|nr:tetratricopeptide repeat protein [Candidatus Acidoferrales bacterium]